MQPKQQATSIYANYIDKLGLLGCKCVAGFLLGMLMHAAHDALTDVL